MTILNEKERMDDELKDFLSKCKIGSISIDKDQIAITTNHNPTEFNEPAHIIYRDDRKNIFWVSFSNKRVRKILERNNIEITNDYLRKTCPIEHIFNKQYSTRI